MGQGCRELAISQQQAERGEMDNSRYRRGSLRLPSGAVFIAERHLERQSFVRTFHGGCCSVRRNSHQETEVICRRRWGALPNCPDEVRMRVEQLGCQRGHPRERGAYESTGAHATQGAHYLRSLSFNGELTRTFANEYAHRMYSSSQGDVATRQGSQCAYRLAPPRRGLP